MAVVAGDARNGGCPLNISRDGGLSWETTVPTLAPEDLPYCVQNNFGPVAPLAFASDGTLYAGFSGSSFATNPPHPRGPMTALAARVENLGASHETFTVAESDPFVYTPAPAADGSTAPTTTVPETPGSTVPGAPPAPAVPAEQTGFEQHRLNSIAVDPNNPDKVYRGWRLGIGGLIGVPGGTIPVKSMISVSDDGAENWSEPLDVASTPEGGEEIFGSDVPMLVVDGEGAVYGFTKERPRSAATGQPDPLARLLMFKSTDGGGSWTTSVINEGAQDITNPAAAVDPETGNLYVVYNSRGESTDEGEAQNASEVYFLTSSDAGATWSEPINITDDDPAAGANQYSPGISVAPDGRIDVAWYDFRNDPFFEPGVAGSMGTSASERYWDVYLTSSGNAGGTWSANTRITNPSIDGSVGVTFNNNDIIGPMGVAAADNASYLAWADTRPSADDGAEAEDVYFSRVRYAAAPALGTAAEESNELLWGLLGAGAALGLGGLLLFLVSRSTAGGRKPEAAAAG